MKVTTSCRGARAAICGSNRFNPIILASSNLRGWSGCLNPAGVGSSHDVEYASESHQLSGLMWLYCATSYRSTHFAGSWIWTIMHVQFFVVGEPYRSLAKCKTSSSNCSSFPGWNVTNSIPNAKFTSPQVSPGSVGGILSDELRADGRNSSVDVFGDLPENHAALGSKAT